MGLSSVNPVEKTENVNNTSLVHATIVSGKYDTTENLFKIYIMFYIVR